MGMIIKMFVNGCVGTCITLLVLMGYFAVQGTLTPDTGVKIIALLNGIDITGNHLQQVLRASEDREQPDYDEIIDARKREGLDRDLRDRSEELHRNLLSEQYAKILSEKNAMDIRVATWEASLEKMLQGARDEGMLELQRTFQVMEPDQAKKQLLIMYDDERIDDVVTIIKALPMDKRSEVLAEFQTDPEALMVDEILKRIGDGKPTTELIEEAMSPNI